MNFGRLKIKIEEESYNSRKKLNLRGANSPPVAPSDVKKCLPYKLFTRYKAVFGKARRLLGSYVALWAAARDP